MSRTSAIARTGERKRRARLLQDEITRVAAVCFSELGYKGTTLELIAADAGISKATLYKYVSRKEELLWRVFEQTLKSFRGGLRKIVDQPLSADEKLRRIVHHQVELLSSHLPFLTVFFSEESELPPELAKRIAREKREYDRAIERVVREGIEEGIVRKLPPTLLVFAVLGMCNWLYKWYRPQGVLTPPQIADVFVGLLERGYLIRGNEEARHDQVLSALRRVEERLAEHADRLPSSKPRGPMRKQGQHVPRC